MYQYNVNDDTITAEYSAKEAGRLVINIRDAFPIDKELGLALVGGAGGGYSLKTILEHFNGITGRDAVRYI